MEEIKWCVGLFKVCSKCGEDLPVSAFSKNKSRLDGLNGWCKDCYAKDRETNKEKIAVRQKEWYEANKELVKDRSRSWNERNPEQKRENNKRWREENLERKRNSNRIWRIENPEKVKESSNKWYNNNIGQAREDNRVRAHRRRARKLEAPFDADITLTGLCERDGDYCSYCKILLLLDSTTHIDHIIPLSRGGHDTWSNVVLACAHCNLSKGSKLLFEEWMPPVVIDRIIQCMLGA